jgi:hypothetical protein
MSLSNSNVIKTQQKLELRPSKRQATRLEKSTATAMGPGVDVNLTIKPFSFGLDHRLVKSR